MTVAELLEILQGIEDRDREVVVDSGVEYDVTGVNDTEDSFNRVILITDQW